jgi:hypothetical protein
MSLSLGERRRLRRIERSLDGSDSRLTSLYSIFNRLARADAMPARERVGIRARRVPRQMRAGDPSGVLASWLGYPVPSPGYQAYVTTGRNARPAGRHRDRPGKAASLAGDGQPRHRGGMRRLVSRVRVRGFSF